MTMSLHLVEHRVRDLPRLWRRRDRLVADIERAPGVAVARLAPDIALQAATGGAPRLRRTILLVGWRDRAARDASLTDEQWAASYTSGATESWSLALDTVRVVRGDWHGWRPDADGVARPVDDEPIAAITYGVVRPASLAAFFQGNRQVCRGLDHDPAQVFRTGFIDSRLGFGTVTLWRSQRAMTRFAYRAPAHEPIRRRFNAEDRMHSHFFARFRPVASRGTWRGRDLLGELVDTGPSRSRSG